MNAERIGETMDTARLAQEQYNTAARAANQPPANRNEFLMDPNVQTVFAENVIAPIAGSIFAEAASDQSQHGRSRLEATLKLTPAEAATLSDNIRAKLASVPADATKGQISQSLQPNEAWFYDRFMRAEKGRPATRLDGVLASLEDREVIPGMSDKQWDIMNNSVDYAAGLTGALRQVNEGVNRKMTIATNNSELFAQDPATMSPADRKKLEGFILRADINAEEFVAMQKAARAEIRRSQGPNDEMRDAADAHSQAKIDALREKLEAAAKSGNDEHAKALSQQIQAALAAQRRAPGVEDLHSAASIDARHQAQIDTLKKNLEAATNRGDTLLAADLQARLQSAEDRYEGARYQHVNALRVGLTNSHLRRLNGSNDARKRVDLNALASTSPAGPGGPSGPGGPGGPKPPHPDTKDPRGRNRVRDRNKAYDEALQVEADIAVLPKIAKELNSTRSTYIEMSAQQRSGHLGRLETQGSRFRLFLERMVKNGVSKVKSQELDAEVEHARLDHRENFERLYGALLNAHVGMGNSPDTIRASLIDLGVKDYMNIENGILDQRQASAQSWVARTWAQRSRATRGAIVGAPAAAAGVGAGIVVGAMSAPVLALAGGVLLPYAGRKYGQRIAAAANRGAGADRESTDARIAQGVNNIRAFGMNRAGAPNEFSIAPDHTTVVESDTITQVRENQRRRGAAGGIGALAAGIGFGVGNFVGSTLATPSGAETPSGTSERFSRIPDQVQSPVTGGEVQPPTIPNVDVNNYPWTVAHGMTPGNEFATIQNAMDVVNNASNGTHNLHFVTHNGFVQVYDGAHALNAAQQAAFNTVMLLNPLG